MGQEHAGASVKSDSVRAHALVRRAIRNRRLTRDDFDSLEGEIVRLQIARQLRRECPEMPLFRREAILRKGTGT